MSPLQPGLKRALLLATTFSSRFSLVVERQAESCHYFKDSALFAVVKNVAQKTITGSIGR